MEKTDSYIEQDNQLDYMFKYSEEEKQDIEIAKANSELIFSPKYIIIQTEWMKELSLIQAYIFGFIDYYLGSEEGKRFYFTNNQIAKICNCGERTVQDSIQALEKLGYINTSRKIKAGGGQIRFIKLNSSTSKNCRLESQNTTGLSSKNTPTNNNYINNNYINNSSLSSIEDNSLESDGVVELNNITKKNNVIVELNNIKEKETLSSCSIKEEKNKIKKDEIENREKVFESLWDWYCDQNTKKQTEKKKAKTYFDKLIKTKYDLDLLRYAVPRYIASVTNKQYIVLLRTYLSNESYLDYKSEFDKLNNKEEHKEEVKICTNEIPQDFEIKYKRTYEIND